MNLKIKRKELLQYILLLMVILPILLRHTYFTSYRDDSRTTIDNILSIMRYLAMIFSIIQIILYSQYKVKQWFIIVFCVGISCISTILSKDSAVILNTIALIALLDMPKEKLIKELLIISSLVLIITVFFSQIGIFPNIFRDSGTRNRYMLGFKWPTYGATIFYFCVVDYIILKHGKITKLSLLIILLINYILYKFTNTRSVFFEILILITFFFLFEKKIDKLKGLEKKMIIMVPWFAAFLSYIMAYIYDQSIYILNVLNKIFTQRLNYGNIALKKYGISILGQYVQWSQLAREDTLTVDNLCVDSSFLDLLIRKGLLFLIIILIIYSVIIRQLIKKGEKGLVVICLFVIMFCITEPWLINIAINPIPLLLCKGIKDTHQSVKREYKRK